MNDKVIEVYEISKRSADVLAIDALSFAVSRCSFCALPGGDGVFLKTFTSARQHGLLLHIGE